MFLLTAIINAVTLIVNASVTWLTSMVTAVTAEGNELLLFFILVNFVGIAIGLLMRFVRR